MHRYYRLRLEDDLFGGVALVREWGRTGTHGRRRIDLFGDAGCAQTALLRLLARKRTRGYRMIGIARAGP